MVNSDKYSEADAQFDLDRYTIQENLAYVVGHALTEEYNDFQTKCSNYGLAIRKMIGKKPAKLSQIEEATYLMETDNLFYHRVFLPNFFLADLVASVMLEREPTVQEYSVAFSTPYFEGLQTLFCCTDLTIREPGQTFKIDQKSFRECADSPALALQLVEKFISSSTKELLANFMSFPDFMFMLKVDNVASIDLKAYYDKYKRANTPLQCDSKYNNVAVQAVSKARSFILQKLPGANFTLDKELPQDCRVLEHFLTANSIWAKLSCLAQACERLCEKEENINSAIFPRFELHERDAIVMPKDGEAYFQEVGVWKRQQLEDEDPFAKFGEDGVPVEQIEEAIMQYVETVTTVRGAKPQKIDKRTAKTNAYVINKLV